MESKEITFKSDALKKLFESDQTVVVTMHIDYRVTSTAIETPFGTGWDKKNTLLDFYFSECRDKDDYLMKLFKLNKDFRSEVDRIIEKELIWTA